MDRGVEEDENEAKRREADKIQELEEEGPQEEEK